MGRQIAIATRDCSYVESYTRVLVRLLEKMSILGGVKTRARPLISAIVS